MSKESADNKKYALAIETSGTLGSIAVGQGQDVIESRMFDTPHHHAAEFLPVVKSLCQQHTIDPDSIRQVYVSCGPGSFTGLRIGITAARMMALAVGARIVAVPTLEVIVQNADTLDHPPDQLAVILDAKRKRIYAATFTRRHGKYRADGEPDEVDPATFLAALEPQCGVVGEGVSCCRDTIENVGLTVLPESLHAPRAQSVYHLGAARAQAGMFISPRDLIPLYIRLPEAEEKWQRRHKSNR